MKHIALFVTIALAGCAGHTQHIRVGSDQKWYVIGHEVNGKGEQALRHNIGDTGPVDIYVWDGEELK